MALGLAWRSRVLDAAGGRHRTQSAGCPAAAAASRRWRRCVVAAAATQQGAAAAAEPQQRVERVLRYPDGNERRIIYPTTTPSEDAQRASALLAEEGLDEDGFSAWAFSDTELDEMMTSWSECSLAGAACIVQDADPLVEELASRQQQPKPANLTELVRSSYQILTGSPWLLPRPLYVLAQQSMFGGHATMYSVQAKQQEQLQDELSAVLNMPDLSQRLSFSRLKDGVVVFGRAEDAARFATCLEAELYGQVEVMEVDSHHLFSLTGGADALVVYLPGGVDGFLPMPQQLMKALRQ